MLVGKYESNATALRLALQYRWETEGPLSCSSVSIVTGIQVESRLVEDMGGQGGPTNTSVTHVENQ